MAPSSLRLDPAQCFFSPEAMRDLHIRIVEKLEGLSAADWERCEAGYGSLQATSPQGGLRKEELERLCWGKDQGVLRGWEEVPVLRVKKAASR